MVNDFAEKIQISIPTWFSNTVPARRKKPPFS